MAEPPLSESVPDPSDLLGEGSGDDPIVIANEFNDVRVRRVGTRNGVRLEILSPGRGTRVLLDAVVLDCLSYQPPETFTEMLERTPRPDG